MHFVAGFVTLHYDTFFAFGKIAVNRRAIFLIQQLLYLFGRLFQVAPRSKLSNFLIDLQLIESAAKDLSLIKKKLPENKAKSLSKASVSIREKSKHKV